MEGGKSKYLEEKPKSKMKIKRYTHQVTGNLYFSASFHPRDVLCEQKVIRL